MTCSSVPAMAMCLSAKRQALLSGITSPIPGSPSQCHAADHGLPWWQTGSVSMNNSVGHFDAWVWGKDHTFFRTEHASIISHVYVCVLSSPAGSIITVRCNKKTPQCDSVSKIRSVCRPGMMLDATFVGTSRPYHAHLSFERNLDLFCFVSCLQFCNVK